MRADSAPPPRSQATFTSPAPLGLIINFDSPLPSQIHLLHKILATKSKRSKVHRFHQLFSDILLLLNKIMLLTLFLPAVFLYLRHGFRSESDRNGLN